jgi:hypothetical protein
MVALEAVKVLQLVRLERMLPTVEWVELEVKQDGRPLEGQQALASQLRVLVGHLRFQLELAFTQPKRVAQVELVAQPTLGTIRSQPQGRAEGFR